MTDTTQNRKFRYRIKAVPKKGKRSFTYEQLQWLAQNIIDKVNTYSGNLSYHTMPAYDYYAKVIGDGEHEYANSNFWDVRNNWDFKIPNTHCTLSVRPTAWSIMGLLNRLGIKVEKETL